MDCSTLRSPTLLIFRADLEVESSPMRVLMEQVILICQPLFAGKSANFIPKYPLSIENGAEICYDFGNRSC